jgi:hypothetical protein
VLEQDMRVFELIYKRQNVYLFAILSMLICDTLLQVRALAKDVAVSQHWQQLIELYIKNEFSAGNKNIRKFERVGPFAITIECGSLGQNDCENAKQLLGESFEPSANVLLIPSELGLISFVFDTSAHLESMLPIAIKDYAGGVSDTSDRQCSMFYKHTASRIQKGKILIATDQPNNKYYSCLVFQIGRLLGPGFSLTERFSDAWDKAFKSSSNSKLKQIAHIYGVLEYMHMCPELVAGMSETEARRVLLRPNGCMSKLQGIN